MVNEYRVILHARPAARLPEKTNVVLNFPSDGMSAQIDELTQIANGQAVPVGLVFDMKVSADSLDHAITKANSMADGIASFVTLVTGVGIPLVKPVQCIETTGGKTERDHIQFFDDIPVAEPSRHILDPNALIHIMDRYSKLSDKNVADRVARAGRWYRQGTIKIDLYDRFSSYWIGLEAVNHVLQDALGIVENSERCTTCGYKPMPTMSGVKEFVKRNFDATGELYKSLRRQRVKIMHSTTALGSISDQVQELTPRLGNVLLASIYFLCGVLQPWLYPNEIISNSNPSRMAMVSKVVSESVRDSMTEDGKLPYWTAVHKLDSLRGEDGKMKYTTTTTFTAMIGKGAQFKAHKLRVYGEGEGVVQIDKVVQSDGKRLE
jgi:hypothetical protein